MEQPGLKLILKYGTPACGQWFNMLRHHTGLWESFVFNEIDLQAKQMTVHRVEDSVPSVKALTGRQRDLPRAERSRVPDSGLGAAVQHLNLPAAQHGVLQHPWGTPHEYPHACLVDHHPCSSHC